jgi:hypothetical protein
MTSIQFIKRTIIFLILFFLVDYLISLVLFNDLNKTFNLDHHPEILINGSSMSGSGFNTWEIGERTNKQIAAYIREGVSVVDRNAMIEHFFHLYPEGIETVVYEVNPVLLSGIKTAANVYTHFYPFMDDRTIDRYIRERATPREYYIHKLIRTTRFESRSFIGFVTGLVGFSRNIKTNTLDEGTLRPLMAEKGTEDVIINEENRKVFEQSMETILSHHARVILVMMPMHYIKLQTFNEEGYRKLTDYYQKYALSRDSVEFLDLNRDSMIYDARNFADPLHFNANGQQQITNIISDYINKNHVLGKEGF